jgi:mannose/fructose/N-acetylgalactosamine-specific phosphotransferase system component IID
MSPVLSKAALVSAFARSFLIQGSWNYRTMLGGGFAFAMLPALRGLFADSGARQEAMLRHLELFNAHPYMSNLALGAAVKLESEGADADTVRRFKLAVRGPLGSIGDGLVWATWLPGVSLLALTLYWVGVPGWLAVVTFLVVYNVGHVGLRLWAFRAGLADGRQVGGRLARADLGGWKERLQGIASLLLGALVAAVLLSGRGLVAAGLIWAALAAVACVAGALVGHRAWRPAAATVVAAVVAVAGLSAMGWIS